MNIKNIIITFVSAIALLLSTSVVSFAKVVGDKIVLGAAISLTGNIHLMVFILKMVITWPLIELMTWVE